MNFFSVIPTGVVLCAGLSIAVNSVAFEASVKDGHNHTSKNGQEKTEEEHKEGISFSPEKMALANIRVSSLTPKIFAGSVYAPGEIKANGYTSYIVSPRTESVVVSRHATLGEHVEKGQKLVTLFSESVAIAQSQFRTAWPEWQRVTIDRKSVV